VKLTILGLSITSSWGNGHATTFRGLVREMARRGHEIVFLERDVPWYAAARDLPEPPGCRTELYLDPVDLRRRFAGVVAGADAVMVGSYVPDGIEVGDWAATTARGVTAFYDIDTPVTLTAVEAGRCEYLTPELMAVFDVYLSFAGGAVLDRLVALGARRAHALYCSVDTEAYFPEKRSRPFDLGYMGTYSEDRQPPLEALLLDPARTWRGGRFVVAGPQYPDTIRWPDNVERVSHLPPECHRRFYNSQRFTLNVTRADMVRLGWSPSVRLFEAAACGVPIISDTWEGLDELLSPGEEILLSDGPETTLSYLRDLDEDRRCELGRRARERVLGEHTARHRARQLETYLTEAS
jgi:spore maturation protein CgeB